MGNGTPGPGSTRPPADDADDRLRLAIEEAGLATWDVDLCTHDAIWSANHFRLFGYPVDPTGRATFHMWSSRLHPEDRQRVIEEIERAARERTFYRSEYRILRADTGELVWLEPRGRFFYDSEGRARRQVGICLDITTRKQAEERLVRREAQLDLATRLVGVGVFDHDHLENRVYWSDQFRQIHDIPPGIEPTFPSLDAHIHPDDRAELSAAVAAAHDPAGGGQFSFEYRIKRRDGEIRRIAGRAQTLFIGEGAERRPVRTVGAELDVTDRRLGEAKIRDSEARFRTMADGSPVMIWAMDANGRIEFANRAVCEFFGTTLKALQSTGWDPLLHPDDVLPYFAAYEAAVAEPQTIPCSSTGAQSERRLALDRVDRDAATRAGRRVLGLRRREPRHHGARRGSGSAARSRSAQGRFPGDARARAAQPTRADPHGCGDADAARLVGAQTAWARAGDPAGRCEHMARLLDDLLDVARITRGKVELKNEPVDLGDVVDTAIEAARPLIDGARSTV